MNVWWCDAPGLPASAIGSSFDIRLTPHPITKYGPPGKRAGSGSEAARTASAGNAVHPGGDERGQDQEDVSSRAFAA